ncbi:MAG: histidine phosphatase family protein [Roseivirga sp.]|nr:histidine phosphatase family protein [Roseivirga sp.]
MKRLLFFAIIVLTCSQSSFAQEKLTTFVLIRHAEKADDGTRNPGLTAEGEARAERLKELFKNADIAAIYSTPYKRTQSTVAPLAKSVSLEVKEYNPRGTGFINEIMKDHAGGTIIVSGHSNTTPFVANALLGNQQFAQLDESEYNKIFVVTISEVGKGTVTMLNY